MKLELKRQPATANACLGSLYVNGIWECYTLERPEVMIPCGTFPVVIRMSPTHKELRPYIDNVPGRTDIEMHIGNWPRDSKGCVLVGQLKGDSSIGSSGLAFHALMQKLEGQTDISIQVYNII